MRNLIDKSLQEINKIVLGKEKQVKLALSCILAKGHLLIEDIPGLGKTTLSQTISKFLSLEFKRIQFTSDLLPSDILGATIFNRENNNFVFHKGPLFSQMVLADEINRATAKTQSALLEAMEEKQISIDGNTYSLPDPFFVIATSNPSSQGGTFTLPESQMDRFLMRISLGYPSFEVEKEILKGGNGRSLFSNINSILTIDNLRQCQMEVQQVAINDDILNYILKLVEATRYDDRFSSGISPRGSISLMNCSKAFAYIENRAFVTPNDIKEIFPFIASHRINSKNGQNVNNLIDSLLKEVSFVY